MINQPNPALWETHSSEQVYMTALQAHWPKGGPGVTFAAEVPDFHHYKGSFGGRVYLLWGDRERSMPNIKGRLF